MEYEKINSSISDYVIEIRRHLHRNPELSFKEEDTARFICDRLNENGYKAERIAGTGVLAGFDSGRPGPVLILRADIDALAVQEGNGSSYASAVPGVMHACGHDGHTAILLGVAAGLPSLKDRMKGKVILLFQPAEECPPGGALEMLKSNSIPKANAVIGAHLMTFLPVGKIGISSGAVTASVDRFTIDIEGVGGHGSAPHYCVDPIVIGAQLVGALQTIASRKVDPIQPVVLSVGSFHAGTEFNIIPQKATLSGTVRCHSEKIRNQVEQEMAQIISGICETFGAKGHLNYERGYPVLVNAKENTEFIKNSLAEYFGEENLEILTPVMGSEDFAYYSSLGPLTYFIIGGGNEEKGLTYYNHHPKFDFDEKALIVGVQAFVKILESFWDK